ncbi:MAG: hypothetical protein NTW74_10030 [Acidobacteria bacterium]|nr:hypothetical protein [Acidobacteriota bacterium]
MDITPDLLLRWAHLFPAIVLVGGAVGGSLMGAPNVAPLARGVVVGGMVTMLTSGLITMNKLLATAPKGWHMWFGIKFLFALHVFAMLFLLTKPDATPEKRKRWQLLAVLGLVVVVFAGGYLRQLRGA